MYVYVFGWPSAIGGAETKLTHLVKLLHTDVKFTVIPPHPHLKKQTEWTHFLNELSIPVLDIEQLPKRLSGFVLCLCVDIFFATGAARRLKERGLAVIWSNETMELFPGEFDALRDGLIDKVLYVSEAQRESLERHAIGVEGHLVGNFIRAEDFPRVDRIPQKLTIGRLSRPDPLKYPEDFPVQYEELKVRCRFRVMAWNEKLQRKFSWHNFGTDWDLLRPGAESAAQFLGSIDLFIYSLGPNVQESWGRSIVEAMFTGAVPLLPDHGVFKELIVSNESGFLYSDFKTLKECTHLLSVDHKLRRQMSLDATARASKLCCPADHRENWLKVFGVK